MGYGLLKQLFPTSVIAAIAIVSIAIVAVVFLLWLDLRKSRHGRMREGFVFRTFVSVLAVSAGIVILHLIGQYAQRELFRFAAQPTTTLRLQITVAVTALVLGISAFVIKLANQFWYGVLEVLASIVFAMNASAQLSPTHPNQMAVGSALLGALYVVVRGFSNMTEGSLGKIETLDDFIEKVLSKLGSQASPSALSTVQSPR